MTRFLLLGWMLGMAAGFPAQAANKTQAQLLFSATTVRPGDTVQAGVLLQMPPGWHTYWRYAGESGAPTEIKWTLPTGVTNGAIQWPVPEKYTDSDLTTYVFHKEVLLKVPFHIASNAPAGRHEVVARVNWLECEKLCVPGRITLTQTLEIAAQTVPSSNAPLFAEWEQRLPQEAAPLNPRAWWEGPVREGKRPLLIEWQGKKATAGVDFYPFRGSDYEVRPATEILPAAGGTVRLRKQVEVGTNAAPAMIAGLLVEKTGGAPIGYEAALKVEANAPAGSAPSDQAGVAAVSSERSLAAMLWLAFLGGLILNVMPCVLPVIALKVLGFVTQGHHHPGRVKFLGVVYALGVFASFAILAGIIIAVQQAGHRASWGMQFGNPKFLVILTVLMTLIALNLFGVFEINLGGRALSTAGNLSSRDGAAGAFFNGLLTTALATSCSAPYLGLALGFAFVQPPGVIVMMFAAIALGLALPYLILSFNPRLLKWLPKPGAWMERFKIVMGFPMLGTAFWLMGLTITFYGRKVWWLGIFLVLVSVAAWIYGEFIQRNRKHPALAWGFAALLLIGGYAYAMEGELRWRHPAPAGQSGVVQEQAGGIAWQPWSRDAVAAARAQGRPVFVDFTADWCPICQANKKTSIEIDSVREKLREINAVTLLADYTRVPDDMTEELARHGRAGVPMVLVYPRDPNAPPQILPELLTPTIVLNALNAAAGKTP